MSAEADSGRAARKGAQAVLRRCLDNVGAALALLARPPRQDLRLDPHLLWPLSAKQSGIAAGVALAIFVFGMVFIDAAAIRGVTHLPRAIVWCFDQITDFGKSGWFLYPLGVVLNSLGWFGFAEFAFFIAILALAYVYIWRKGALKWR